MWINTDNYSVYAAKNSVVNDPNYDITLYNDLLKNPTNLLSLSYEISWGRDTSTYTSFQMILLHNLLISKIYSVFNKSLCSVMS